MRTVWTLVSGFVVALVLAPAATAGWVQHNAPEFGFSGVFPKAPEYEASTSDGVKMNTFVGAAPGALCIIIAADYPYVINPDEETIASRDSFVKGVGATLKTSKRVTFARGSQQLPAIAFEADSASMKFKSLIVIDGSRAYQVGAGIPIPDGDTAELDTCVGGFVLTPKS